MPRKYPRIHSLSDLTPPQFETLREHSQSVRDPCTGITLFLPSLHALVSKVGLTPRNARIVRGLLTTSQRRESAAYLTSRNLMRAHTCLTCWKPLYPTQHRYCSRACLYNRRGHHASSPHPSILRTFYFPPQCDPNHHSYDPTVRPITTTAQLEAMLQRIKSNPTDPLAHLDRTTPPATTPPTPL